MAKLEIIQRSDRKLGPVFCLQATYREPMEYFFEIALLNDWFAHPRDAAKAKLEIEEALREDRRVNGYRSESFVLGRDKWSYSSSAYEGKMGTSGEIRLVPASEDALAADRRADAL